MPADVRADGSRSAGGDPPPEPVRPTSPPDPVAAEVAYVASRAALIAQRLSAVTLVLGLGMGGAVVLEWFLEPVRTPVSLAVYLVELLACGVALAAVRVPAFRLRSRAVAVALCLVLAGLVGWHVAHFDGPPERLSSAYTCLLTSTVLLLPWGWRPQLVLSLACAAILAALAMGGALGATMNDAAHTVFMMSAGAGVSAMAAAYVDRYRREAFVRAGLLDQASVRQRADYLLLDVIHRVQSRFIASGDANALFGTLLNDLLGLTGSEFGFVGEVLHRPTGEPCLRTLAMSNVAWDDRTRSLWAQHAPNFEFMNLETLFGAVMLTGKPVLANDPADDPRRGGLPAGHPPLQAFLGVPFHNGGELVGIAGVANRPGGYTPELVAYLQPLLSTSGTLIAAHRQARQREEIEAALAEEGQITAAVARAGRELNASLDTPVVLERLCQLTADVLACEVSATLLWDPEGDVYVPMAITGMQPDDARLAREVRVAREFISMLFSQAEQEDSVEIGDVTPDRLVQIGLATAPAPRFLCLALRHAREIVGIQIVCAFDRKAPFSRAERRIADGLARMASMSLTNARLLGDLQRANQLKSEFVSTMSHELRTPLNVILGYAEMACDVGLPEDEQHECMGRIVTAGRELLDLIESTLEIGRIESASDQVRIEPVALVDFWTELGDACSRLPRRETDELRWGPAARLQIATDPRKLTVIVRNLVGNALKFTERGAVEVDVLAGDRQLVLRVADSGIGIRADDHQVIFEMFRQADGSDSRRYGGTGLGLYICKRFVEQLGGTITVASTPGKGSVFTVTLPSAMGAGHTTAGRNVGADTVA